ncbi:MAG: rhodanese-like domain-containing protein [Actinomycetota bacterium]
MTVTTTVRRLTFDEALEVVALGGALLDLRPAAAYLETHVPGSIAVVYEAGPGMSVRARDCLPLEIPYALLDLGHGDAAQAAAALRGRGFNVAGAVEDALNRWAGKGESLASTEVLPPDATPEGTLLHVGDPGAVAPPGAVVIPADDLWPRTNELTAADRIVVVAGYGVRAALCVGILERKGFGDVALWPSDRALRPIR